MIDLKIIGPKDSILLDKDLLKISQDYGVNNFIVCKVYHIWNSEISPTAFIQKQYKYMPKKEYYYFIKVKKQKHNAFQSWGEKVIKTPKKYENIVKFCNEHGINFIDMSKGRKRKKIQVVGEGYSCEDKEYIKCSVKNMWDFKTKSQAESVDRDFTYYFQKYTRHEYIDYKGNKQISWKVKKIENPQDYPEIIEYCNEYNIKLLTSK